MSLAEAKSARNKGQVSDALIALSKAAQKDENLMPSVIQAVEVCATEGEVMGALRDVYGEYIDPGVF